MKKAALICVMAWLGLAAMAKPANAITITEHTVELFAKPGDIVERQMYLYDDQLQGAKVYVSVSNFIPDPSSEGSALLVTDAAELKADREWIKLSADTIDLPATGGLTPFTYKIELPQGADPGTHMLSIVFSTKPPVADPNSTVVSVGTNILTNIFLKVAGATIDNIEPTFKVGTYANTDPLAEPAEREKSFKEKKIFFRPPVDFLVRVANKGNTHQKPDGNIKIVNDLFSQSAEVIPVNDDHYIVAPGTSRAFGVDPFGHGIMLGKYRAKLTLVYGQPLRDVTKEIDFWIIPVKEIAIALAVLILLIVSLMIWRKYAKRRNAAKDKRKEEEIRQTLREEIKATMQEARQDPKAGTSSSKSNQPPSKPSA